MEVPRMGMGGGGGVGDRREHEIEELQDEMAFLGALAYVIDLG